MTDAGRDLAAAPEQTAATGGHDRFEQQARRDALLARASAAFARAGRDVGAIVHEALAELTENLCDGVTLHLASEDGTHLDITIAYRGQPEAEASLRRVLEAHPLRLDEDGPAQRAFRLTEPILVAELDAEAVAKDSGPFYEEHNRRFPAHSAMVLPLRVGSHHLGVLTLHRSVTKEAFTPDDLVTGVDLADRAALAIDNARIFAAQQRTEAALRESEARFRSTFDNAPVGMATVSLHPETSGWYLTVNDAFCTLVGYDRGDIVGRPATSVFESTFDLEADAARLLAVRPFGRPVTLAGQARRADGELVDLRIVAAVVPRGGEPDHVIIHVEDVTASKRIEDLLRRRALYDDLTGLPNRYLFMDHLALAIKDRGRKGGDVAVVFLDVDRFKDLNDSFGHHTGDQVLREIGSRLRAAVRATDTAARLAGDEFVVLCPEVTDPAAVVHVVERLRDELSHPFTVVTRQLTIQASIGVATTSTAPAGVDELLRAADAAMYHAKRRGPGHWALYSPTIEHRIRHRHETEQKLRDALRHNRLRLHYQPVIDLRDNRILGTEALLRLDDPDRGLLMPSSFIDVAEDSDLIIPIGEWVLAEACRQAAQWNQRFGPIEMAVNLSGRQVTRSTTCARVREALAGSHLEPARLCIEVTERIFVEAGVVATRDLAGLVDDGVHLALDDFGTGYSSLAYLKQFPVAIIKIDRSFVHDLAGQGHNGSMVRAIAAFAHELRLTTIAEGIERAGQLDALRALHCDRGQGYLLHRPAPAEAVTALLEAQAT